MYAHSQMTAAKTRGIAAARRCQRTNSTNSSGRSARFNSSVKCAAGPSYKELLAVAEEAARAGAAIVQDAVDKPRNISSKSTSTDLVTETDLASEAAILAVLRKHFPTHAILGEEGGVTGDTNSEYLWCVDPLDGTTNFAHGYPSFAVLVACCKHATPVASTVVEFGGGPGTWVQRVYSASRNGGATMNGAPISVSGTRELVQSLVTTGFGYDHDAAWMANMGLFQTFTDVTRGVRRLGSAGVDMCHVACGLTEAYWEPKLKPWDQAAGALVVEEAGGTVTTMDGRAFSVFDRSVLVSNTHLHQQLLDIIEPVTTDLVVNKGADLTPFKVGTTVEGQVTTGHGRSDFLTRATRLAPRSSARYKDTASTPGHSSSSRKTRYNSYNMYSFASAVLHHRHHCPYIRLAMSAALSSWSPSSKVYMISPAPTVGAATTRSGVGVSSATTAGSSATTAAGSSATTAAAFFFGALRFRVAFFSAIWSSLDPHEHSSVFVPFTSTCLFSPSSHSMTAPSPPTLTSLNSSVSIPSTSTCPCQMSPSLQLSCAAVDGSHAFALETTASDSPKFKGQDLVEMEMEELALATTMERAVRVALAGNAVTLTPVFMFSSSGAGAEERGILWFARFGQGRVPTPLIRPE